MEIRTVSLIILAALTAITIVFFQYFHKNPKQGSLKFLLAALRFVTIFGALLLLINPKFVKQEYFNEKSNLVILMDDSASMENASLEQGIRGKLSEITANKAIKERFSILQYAFGPQLRQTDSFSFQRKHTDIAQALIKTDEIFSNSTNAIILFTDGNQTLGREYSYLNLNKNTSIHPVVVGDTTIYRDISIALVNVNTYAFLKNKFPVEVNISYNGSKPISKTVSITMNGNVAHRETIDFGANENSKTINVLLEAESVGVKSIKVEVQALENEKNKFNNTKETAIEVIDEKTNVAIISDILHPDLGALKKAIETNEQRSVKILKPATQLNQLDDMDILILYQPNNKFNAVYDYIGKTGISVFTIAGTKTNWTFLNQAQQGYFKENLNQKEEILPVINKAFGAFGLSDFAVINFPPLKGFLGNITFKKTEETLLFQQIRGVNLEKPLLSILTDNQQKEAILFGEDIWKWRIQSYRHHRDFENFDAFIGKLMVYLSNDNQKSRLTLDYELVFDDSSLAKIRAHYFDEAYTFDQNSIIKIQLKGKENDFSRESPMLLKGSFFEVDLSDLEAGEYTFTATVEGENLKRSGSFKILDFNPEKQLLSANYKKLKQLAERTNGKVYFPRTIDSLITDLLNTDRFVPIQKSKQNIVSLIDFGSLLFLIALTLALEWFIRKYNGLI
ncbi:MAG: VWA domain-containing protein [Flavobacteriaceae bacterium]